MSEPTITITCLNCKRQQTGTMYQLVGYWRTIETDNKQESYCVVCYDREMVRKSTAYWRTWEKTND